ncbi:MAG: YraN family protein [Oscillospiraceae bacterium]
MQSKTARARGNAGEDAVCAWLTQRGWRICARNFTVRGGEIDIVAARGEVLAFVEVKTRMAGALVGGGEAINATKRKHLIFAAQRFLQTHPEFDGHDARFDAALVQTVGDAATDIDYYESAFDASCP